MSVPVHTCELDVRVMKSGDEGKPNRPECMLYCKSTGQFKFVGSDFKVVLLTTTRDASCCMINIKPQEMQQETSGPTRWLMARVFGTDYSKIILAMVEATGDAATQASANAL